jgi:hypothetical protein
MLIARIKKSFRNRGIGEKKPITDVKINEPQTKPPLEKRESKEICQENFETRGCTSLGGVAVVSPWRPGFAGQLAAVMAQVLVSEEVCPVIGVIGASGNSTVAWHLAIEEDELIMSDWRIPGSQAPVEKKNLRIWDIDQAKSLDRITVYEQIKLLETAKETCSITVIDCAGDHELAEKLLHQDVAVLFIVPGQDRIEQNTASQWLSRLFATGKKVICGVDLRSAADLIPEGISPEMLIRGSPQEATESIRELTKKLFVNGTGG